MLKKTTPKHFEFIKSLIVEGASTGVFSPELASPLADTLFFHGLWAGISQGSMSIKQRQSGLTSYTYFNQAHSKAEPLGFILIKDDENLTELWMCSIQSQYRGKGLGKLMISEAMQTIKSKNIMGRCSPGSSIALRILQKQGFISLGKGDEGTEFVVSNRMAPALQAELKTHFSAQPE
jgi:RimJ/RimL family protein N-acetyltransferase